MYGTNDLRFNHDGQIEIAKCNIKIDTDKSLDIKSCSVCKDNEGLKLIAKEGSCRGFQLKLTSDSHENVKVYNIHSWRTLSQIDDDLEDIIHFPTSHIYGGCTVYEQHWPITNLSTQYTPFVTYDLFQGPYGGVLEPYWLFSNGVAIYIQEFEHQPLWVSLDSTNRCLGLRVCYSKFPCLSNMQQKIGKEILLSYYLIIGDNMKTVHEFIEDKYFSMSKSMPDDEITLHPIWCTWVRYKADVSEKKVIRMAEEIKAHGFPASQIEIDDRWADKHGDFLFDKIKFPDVNGMMTKLKEMNMRVTLWIHPFANEDSKVYLDESNKDHWLKDESGEIYICNWWNGSGACLDVTNCDARTWFVERLKTFAKSTGIHSYKFDAGEVNWLYRTDKNACAAIQYPNTYSRLWVDVASDAGGKSGEVRVGRATHHLPVWVRMFDKHSSWGYDNGLASLIPTALTMSLLGYPFLLPDMVGGNCYQNNSTENVTLPTDEIPARELYVRWVEATALLPSIQFSVCPWQYDDEVIRICRDMLKLRSYYSSYLRQPIRPTWWLDPCDTNTHLVDDQFLIGGGEVMVCPVLVEGATSRHIYLPHGCRWKEEGLNEKIYDGGLWLNDYPTPLQHLPIFRRKEG